MAEREPNTGINQRACSLHTTTKVLRGEHISPEKTGPTGPHAMAHKYASQEGERNSCKSLNLRACSTQQLRWVWLQGENIGPDQPDRLLRPCNSRPAFFFMICTCSYTVSVTHYLRISALASSGISCSAYNSSENVEKIPSNMGRASVVHNDIVSN